MHFKKILLIWVCVLLLAGLWACTQGGLTKRSSATAAPSPNATPTSSASPTFTLAATSTPAPELLPITGDTLPRLQILAQRNGSDGIYKAAWTRDGSRLVILSSNGLNILETATRKSFWVENRSGTFDLSGDSRRVAQAFGDRIDILSISDGRLLAGSDGCGDNYRVRFSPDGRRLAAGGWDSVLLVDAVNPSCKRGAVSIPLADRRPPKDLIFSPDGSKLVGVFLDHLVVWQTTDGAEEQRLAGSAAVFHPNGRWLAVQDADGVALYEWSSLKLARRFPAYGCDGLSFSPDGRLLVTVKKDGMSRWLDFFDVETGGLLFTFPLPLANVSLAVFSPDGRILMALAKEGIYAHDASLFLLGLPSSPVSGESFNGFRDPVVLPTSAPWYLAGSPALVTPVPPRFPLLSAPYGGVYITPAPIATPSGEAQGWRLKPASAASAVALIREMAEFSYASDVYIPSDYRAGFFSVQPAIRLAGQEYLLRYPQGADEIAVRWRIALSDAIDGRANSDHWIASQIEAGLNAGTVDPADITPAILPFGFRLSQRVCPFDEDCALSNHGPWSALVPGDLFGDGGPTQVIAIDTVEYSTGTLFLAMHQAPGGRFYVLPIHSDWGPFVEGWKVAVQDLTGDGRPEVRIDSFSHNGSSNWSTSFIYHWEGGAPGQGHFREVVGGQVATDYNSWEDYTLTPGGAQDLPGTLHYQQIPLYFNEEIILRWNGSFFVPAERKVPFPLISEWGINRAIADGQYAEVDEAIRAFLAGATDEQRSANWTDRLRFQQGMNAAFVFRVEEARAILQHLAQAPDNPKGSLARIARVFLAAYHRPGDLYQACRAALNEHDRILAPYRASQGSQFYDAIREQFGEDPRISPLCDLESAFVRLTAGWDAARLARLPAELNALGIVPALARAVELEGGARKGWLVVLDEPDAWRDGSVQSVWLLLAGERGSQPLVLGQFSQPLPYRVVFEPLALPGMAQPAYLLQVGAQVKLLRVDPGLEGTAVEPLLEESFDPAAGYQIRREGDSLAFVIHPAFIYRQALVEQVWDAPGQRFMERETLEEELLLRGQWAAALRELPTLISQTRIAVQKSQYSYAPREELARLEYRLGLAYELSGDAPQAAQVYYALWQEFPDLALARMARAKLEVVQP